jgi:hypothetical protein
VEALVGSFRERDVEADRPRPGGRDALEGAAQGLVPQPRRRIDRAHARIVHADDDDVVGGGTGSELAEQVPLEIQQRVVEPLGERREREKEAGQCDGDDGESLRRRKARALGLCHGLS